MHIKDQKKCLPYRADTLCLLRLRGRGKGKDFINFTMDSRIYMKQVFMWVQLLPSPASAGIARYHYSWVGWSNVNEASLLQEVQLQKFPHTLQLYSWIDWNNVDKVLAQGNNNKQHHLGIKPGSSGSQADPKPLNTFLW